MESDAVVQAAAVRLNVPLTIVNPSTVIGDFATGESEQLVGLADSVRELWKGTMAAVPGGRRTFVPVLTVDYLARFMALVPGAPETAGKSYWVLDERTPPLPELLAILGRHLGVRLPKLRIPAGLVKALPRQLTGADPETLSFLSFDRYPTEPAKALALRHGLEFPDVVTALERWADYLVAHWFVPAR